MTMAPEGMADWLSETQADVIEYVGLKCGKDLALTLAVLEGAARDMGSIHRLHLLNQVRLKQAKGDAE